MTFPGPTGGSPSSPPSLPPAGAMPPGPAVPPGGPPGVPEPPPGPGAVPPFAAPPTEGRTLRVWLGLGVAALAVVLVCGGGGAALIGLLISGSQAINEQARAVVGDYFEAIGQDEFGRAYDLLCDSAKQRESPAEFARRVSAEPEIASYRIGNLEIDELSVPVDVTYAQGGQDRLRAVLEQDPSDGLTICGFQ